MFLLELRTHFLLCYRVCMHSLSLYYSLYLINEEQAPCLCLFITTLDVTFEDEETSLMIYNISYTLCTDSKLQQSRKDKKVSENLITYFKVGLRTYISEIEIKYECLIYLLSFSPWLFLILLLITSLLLSANTSCVFSVEAFFFFLS